MITQLHHKQAELRESMQAMNLHNLEILNETKANHQQELENLKLEQQEEMSKMNDVISQHKTKIQESEQKILQLNFEVNNYKENEIIQQKQKEVEKQSDILQMQGLEDQIRQLKDIVQQQQEQNDMLKFQISNIMQENLSQKQLTELLQIQVQKLSAERDELEKRNQMMVDNQELLKK